RHGVLRAEPVEQLLTPHAKRRAQTAWRIVDAGVDHLAVARGGLRADQLVLFQHQHAMPGLGQCFTYRQPHYAGTDDDGLDICRHCGCRAGGVEGPVRSRRRMINLKMTYIARNAATFAPTAPTVMNHAHAWKLMVVATIRFAAPSTNISAAQL